MYPVQDDDLMNILGPHSCKYVHNPWTTSDFEESSDWELELLQSM